MIKLQEKKSSGPLYAYIDLLFLIVCFFILLLHYAGREVKQKNAQVNAIEQQLAGKEKAIAKLQPLAESARKLIQERKIEVVKEKKRLERLRSKSILEIQYTLSDAGKIIYQEKEIDIDEFIDQIVLPNRKKHWLAFRSYASPNTPFGNVIKIRQRLLEKKGEFDTFWSNLK